MQRYFGNVIDNNAVLTEDDNFHLLKVMRAKIGEQIEVVSDERLFLCEVTSIKPLRIEVKDELKENNELKNDIVLICAFLKGEKMDWVIQKATELGVEEIVFVRTERTIVKVNGLEKENKLARYRKIAKEASEQSKRIRVPVMYQIIDLNQISKVKADIKMIAYEGIAGKCSSFNAELKNIKAGNRVAILVGPEGGFSPKEVDFICENGFHQVSLGKRILRAETASIYACSVIANYLEK